MTENKQFYFVYNDGVKYLKINGKVMPDNIALDVLNKLNDENEQLKRQIGNLEHTRDFVGDVCADCNRLENEVDELKSSLDFCRINVKRLNDNKKELNDENKQLKSKYSEQCIQLDFLKAENEHMKEVLDENKQLKHRLKHYEMWFKQEEIREIEIGDWKMKFTSDETE